MIADPSIRQQGYVYFLTEAPELLQTIEQELFDLLDNYSTAKVHNLMRATHTIKGGAANVGLEVINKVAHYLEDVFKALYSPNITLDAELQTLLLQAYECLRLPLTAELTGSHINDEEILQRATFVFAQLQEKLGDTFSNQQEHIPTSEELGFDIVQSIFETGVVQRLDSLAMAIHNTQDSSELASYLRSQAEVFLGLAESLNLSGFKELAQTTIAALDANPMQVVQIAEIALQDFQQAKEKVLAGDRSRGGEPSPALRKLSQSLSISSSTVTFYLRKEAEEFYYFLTQSPSKTRKPLKPALAKFYLKVIRYILGWFHHEMTIPQSELHLSLLISDDQFNWLEQFCIFLKTTQDPQNLCLYRQIVILKIIFAVTQFEFIKGQCNSSITKKLQNRIDILKQAYQKYSPIILHEKDWFNHPKFHNLLEFKDIVNPVGSFSNDSLLETVWGQELTVNSPQMSMIVINKSVDENQANSQQKNLNILPQTTLAVVPESMMINNQSIEDISQSLLTQNSRQRTFIRVDVEGLEHLNYLAGELLVYQKRRSLQDEQFQQLIDQSSQQLQKHQVTLSQLRDVQLQLENFGLQPKNAGIDFATPVINNYYALYLSLAKAIEEVLQLQEITESLELIFKQATQVQEKQQRLVVDIIDNLVDARMLPLGTVLNRFPQMVQNLANMYGKLVDMKLIGINVLVDKAIAERLYEPLLHLVRNAFDHGIESPEIRRQRGKPEKGEIEICAYHQGSQTIIEVRDDGQGLNIEKIRNKATELGLIDAYANEAELLEVLFAPGFSTAGKVSEISGRGMGLDIVRSQLSALKGSVTVESLPQQGTTFILKIPFSMTTDKLMLVQAGGVIYALLLDSIEKILLPSAIVIKEFEGKKVLYWDTGDDEQVVSIHRLSELMCYNRKLNNNDGAQNLLTADNTGIMSNPVLLLRRQQNFFGLEVDQIIGEQELVIRPLGQAIAPPKYIYGCSILANGNLILVIDGALLLETSQMRAAIDVMALPVSHHDKQKALPTTAAFTPLLTASDVADAPKSKIVLIVDDAISLRQTLSLILKKYGYQVLQAENGLEALERLHSDPEIQLVVTDLEMPQMNGFELLSQIRQNSHLADKPVIILTSRSGEKHRQLARELGVTAYLTKPYVEHEFLSVVQSIMANGGHQFTPLGN